MLLKFTRNCEVAFASGVKTIDSNRIKNLIPIIFFFLGFNFVTIGKEFLYVSLQN